MLHAIETVAASAPEEDPEPDTPLPDHKALQQRAVDASAAARTKRTAAAAAVAAALEAQEASKASTDPSRAGGSSRGRSEDKKKRKSSRSRSRKSLADEVCSLLPMAADGC